MGIKNIHIKHRAFLDCTTDRFYYLCNQACVITDEKAILGKWRVVTCKNCLKQKPNTNNSKEVKR